MQNNKSGEEDKVEPKENDKWMENNDREREHDPEPQQSRLDELGKRAKHFASNKYNVIIVLLCIFLLIFFIIVIGLAARLGSISCPEPQECRTFECLNAAASVVARSDYDHDPCTDFWSYSCDGWLKRNPIPKYKGSYSVRDKLKENINSYVRHMIDLVPHDADLASPQLKVKNFYSACMSLGDIEYWVPQKFLHAIHEIGGWAILNTPPGSQWRRNDVLKKLQVTYGVSVFFQLIVEPDDTNPVRNIIKLVPGGLGLPAPRYYYKSHDDMYVKAYKNFIKNLMQELGVTLHEANRFAEDTFHYEKRLAEITPEPEDLRNTKESYTIMTVSELDRLSTSISWTDLLQTYFPGLIEPDTQVAVLSEKYFSDISRLISATDNGLLNDYYMWRLVYTYVPHLSTKYRLVANHFKQTFEGVGDLNLQYEERWEFCMRLTNQFLGHAVGAMYVEHYFPPEAQEKAQIYIHKIVATLHGMPNELSWIEDITSRDSAQSKINSMLLLVGHPGFARNRTLATYYTELKVQADYLQNIKDGVYFLHKKQEEMLKRKALPDYSWTIYPQDVVAEYKYSSNQLVIPAGLLEPPLFDPGAPLAVKYGILGGHVANKLSEIFDDKGINYEMYGVLKPWLSNRSMEAYRHKLDCLRTEISNYSLHGIPVNPDLTLSSFIADIGGVKLAYKTYQRHAAESENKGVLPGMDISNDQLFFISYAQSLCQATRPEKLKAIRDSSENLPDELRVFGTLQQLPEFASAFSCERGSVMNTANKCHMW